MSKTVEKMVGRRLMIENANLAALETIALVRRMELGRVMGEALLPGKRAPNVKIDSEHPRLDSNLTVINIEMPERTYDRVIKGVEPNKIDDSIRGRVEGYITEFARK